MLDRYGSEMSIQEKVKGEEYSVAAMEYFLSRVCNSREVGFFIVLGQCIKCSLIHIQPDIAKTRLNANSKSGIESVFSEFIRNF